MRPILLKGHERSITQLKYNREGDLLFTTSKANFPCLWNADTGERIGTYRGHTGAVWTVDVNYDSSWMISGSADTMAKLWDVETGKELCNWNHKAPVRGVSFAHGGKSFLTVTDQVMGRPPTILIYHLDGKRDTVHREIVGLNPNAKITMALWGPLNKTIIASSDDSTITVWDPETGRPLHTIKDHTKSVNKISFSKDQSHFITASTDHTCKLYDTTSWKLLKSYDTGRPVNAASLSPLLPHILLGGGQAASEVTTTRVDSTQFKLRIFHKIYEEEVASLMGHFGPVNTLSWSPDGRSFASGGEDGYVRVHHLDETYFRLGANEREHYW